MTKRIQLKDSTQGKIVVIGPTLPRIDPSVVQAALGAEPAAEKIEAILGPMSLFALRRELLKRMQSSGGRPELAGATQRATIPLSDQQWSELEQLAAAISSPGF